MQGGIVTRRMQYSSCDDCRRSRVACDAMCWVNVVDDDSSRPASCTRCLNRQRPCTFKWIKDIKGAVPNRASIGKRRERQSRAASPPPRRDLTPLQDSITWTSPATQVRPRDWPPNLDWTAVCTTPIPDNPTGSIISPESLLGSPAYPTLPHPAADVLTALDAQWLSTIYREGFEAIFGSWMGRYSCPFLFGENSLADKYVSISDLCSQLDRWMAESTDEEQAPAFSTRDQQENERDVAIDHSLRSTIEAFSARWLPITARPASLGPGNLNVVQALWRRARRDMLRVINRPSYRSMLTLFLFALTPIPTGISEEEEVDGISGQVCVHAALQQIQSLRARQRNLQFNGSKVLPSSLKTTPAVVAGLVSIGTSSFINAESTAYWAALTFDTSASLTLNCRSLLSSGLFGFKAEPSWRLVRTCAKMFEEDDGVGGGGFEMTDERANQIIAAAAAWKLLGWKLTAVFKEALRDGHDESEIRKAYLAVVDSIEQFNGTYRHLLEACQRRMQFLGQQTRLRWYSLMLHYYLSILLLVDIIEVTCRSDLLVDLKGANTDAESTVMNCLVFGLQNTFTLSIKSNANSNESIHSGATGTDTVASISVPLMSIDPYPHHVVAGVRLLRKAIDRDFGLRKIADDTHASLHSTLERTLSLLPQSSKSVQAARTMFSKKVSDGVLAQHQDPYVELHTDDRE